MTLFWKLNGVSMLYAFIIFTMIELLVNASRISRLTGRNMKVVSVMAIVGVILLSALSVYVTKRWLNGRMSSFWSVLLWFPYLILFILIAAFLFPSTNPADESTPGDGLIIMGLLFFYPIYVLFLNVIALGVAVDE